jgi:iron(III) transport system ATP-binding protein
VSPGAVDGVAADVLDVSYFGHDATLRARVRGRDTVVIARVPAGGVPAPGTSVCLRVSGDVQAFPRADAR